MNALTERKIRIGDVLAALGMKRSTLRNWFDRNDVKLISEQQEEGWAEFTLGDVAILAIMRRLVRWGLDVQRANEVAHSVVLGTAGPLFGYRNTPAEAFISLMTGKTLVLFYPEASAAPKVALSNRRDELDFTQVWIKGDAEQSVVSHQYQDILMIDIRSVLLEAFRELEVIDPDWPN